MQPKPTRILAKNFLGLTRGYFERMVQPSLEVTAQTVDPVVKTYVIAGKNICIYFYGETVARVLSLALTQTQAPEGALPDMTIHAWDSVPTQTDITPPWDDTLVQDDEKNLDDFFGVYVGGEESLNFYQPSTRTGYFWTDNVLRMPDWVLGAPFRTIFHWFFNDAGIHFIHGAVVGENSKSVLLTARSGSGKSTTALSCLLSGMEYIADDYVALELGGTVTAHSLYHSAKFTRHALGFFPEFEDIIFNKDFGETEKGVIFLSDVFPGQVKPNASLDAILIPRIVPGGITRIVPTTKMEAMLAIAPTTLLQLPLAETRKVSVFKEILEKMPCYFLDLGPDVRSVPEVIKQFLKNGY